MGGKKRKRLLRRRAIAAKIFPRPTGGRLRPIVHCPTQRYNFRQRLGKGFTLDELKEAKLPRLYALSIGIAVDHRRKNRSVESLQRNVARLLEYKSKLILFPKKAGKRGAKKGDSTKEQLKSASQNTLKAIIPIPREKRQSKPMVITNEMKEFSAFRTIRKARNDKKYYGRRLKKAAEKEGVKA